MTQSGLRKKFLQTLFLREVLAAGASLQVDGRSLKTLSALGRETRYDEFGDNLWSYFKALKPYRRFGDSQGLATLDRPSPLQLHVEPHILHGYFRAWLRRRRK